MDLPENSILQFLILNGYWFAVPIMIVEGPIATIVLAFFASFGYFNPFVVLAVGFTADMISDGVFYAIGYYNGNWVIKRFGKYFKLNEKTFEVVRRFYDKHGGKSVFFAKILSGVVPPIFIVAGYSRMQLRRFYKFAAMGGIIWSSGLVTLGYFFGSQFQGSFGNVARLLTRTGLISVAILALVVVYKFYLHKLLERKLKLVFSNGIIKKDGDEENRT